MKNKETKQGKKKGLKGLFIALGIALPLLAIAVIAVVVVLFFARPKLDTLVHDVTQQFSSEASQEYLEQTPVSQENQVQQVYYEPVEEEEETVEITPREPSFSVGPYKQVAIAKGNLQYNASTYEWRFASAAWDMMGYSNVNISSTYDGWIDLFSWGTGDYPTNTSTNSKDYTVFWDWGYHMGESWRTPTADEWNYLLTGRYNAKNKVAGATVNGVAGIVILPDDWTLPIGEIFNADMSYSSNYYSTSSWRNMEKAGAVFLPTSGRRDGKEVFKQGTDGDYWSSTQLNNKERAYNVDFVNGKILPRDDSPTKHAFAVRLIKDI